MIISNKKEEVRRPKREAWKKTNKNYKWTHPHPLIQRNDIEAWQYYQTQEQ
jgi:hypothetical protein